MKGRLRLTLAALAAATMAAAPATTRQAMTRPTSTSMPATTPPLATVDAAAEPLLARLSAAYAATQPWHVSGSIEGTFDVAGRSRRYHLAIDGRTDGDGRFRHDAADTGLVISDGEHTYLYDRKRDAFATLPATPGRRSAEDIDQALIDVLLDENPALLMTLTDSPTGVLRRAARSIHAAPVTQGAEKGVLLKEHEKNITLWLADDGTVRGSVVDYTPLMNARHATAVVSAKATLVYDTATHDSPPPETFTWHPPATATEFEASDNLMQEGAPATRPTSRPRRG